MGTYVNLYSTFYYFYCDRGNDCHNTDTSGRNEVFEPKFNTCDIVRKYRSYDV